MAFLHSSVAFLTLLASVRPDDGDVTPPPVKAKASMNLGEPHLFSGEDVQLICSVPDDPSPNWMYQWFHDEMPVSYLELYDLKRAQVMHGGSYTCQGRREMEDWPYEVATLQSDPLKIHVDGGWILLRTPFEPVIIEDTMTLTCRVRDDPILSEVIFYKNGIEIKKQRDKDLVFHSLVLEDEGTYSCRATWVQDLQYQSAMSLSSSVFVLDKVNTPRIEFSTGRTLAIVKSGNEVVFRCITKVNVREQGLSVDYYFMKDDNRVGTASAQNTYVISQVSVEDAGFYTCKVRVRALNVERWSHQAELKVRPPLNM